MVLLMIFWLIPVKDERIWQGNAPSFQKLAFEPTQGQNHSLVPNGH